MMVTSGELLWARCRYWSSLRFIKRLNFSINLQNYRYSTGIFRTEVKPCVDTRLFFGYFLKPPSWQAENKIIQLKSTISHHGGAKNGTEGYYHAKTEYFISWHLSHHTGIPDPAWWSELVRFSICQWPLCHVRTCHWSHWSDLPFSCPWWGGWLIRASLRSQ